LSADVWRLGEFMPAGIATRRPAVATTILSDYGQRPTRPRLYRAIGANESIVNYVGANSMADGELRMIATLLPGLSVPWGIASLPGYDAAIPSSLADFWTASLKAGARVLRLLAVDYAILPVADPSAADRREGLTPVLDP